MAKKGLESFLLDCRTNDKVAEIEAVFSIKGFAVLVRLWQKIYAEEGYYCEWNEKSPLLFLANWFGGGSGVTVGFINEIVNYAIKIGLFDEDKFTRYSILTSERVQIQYMNVAKRRKEVNLIKEYLLVSVANFSDVVDINLKNVNRNAENVDINSTSKVKGREVKVSKDKCVYRDNAPTLEEVKSYCNDNELKHIDVDKFYNYYASKNWQGILDWKARAKYWNAEDKKKSSGKVSTPKNTFTDYSQRNYSDEEIEEILRRKAVKDGQ